MSRNPWSLVWRDLKSRLVTKCGGCGSTHIRNLWRRRPRGVRMRGSWYCRADCLERAVSELLDIGGLGSGGMVSEGLGSARNIVAPHRIPLGLLLLSRQQLTADQLRTALDRQRTAGHGRIGEWLQRLGFATERQITAALARQWSCPVLRNSSGTLGASRFMPIPVRLLESIQMIPVEFAEASQTLLIAFSEGIDHSVLYAVEQMLGYRTEACFVCPSVLQKGLEALAQVRGSGDVIFDRVEDARECASIIVSYAAKVAAEEIRLVKCGHHLWIRLQQPERETVNMVMRTSTAKAFTPSSVRCRSGIAVG